MRLALPALALTALCCALGTRARADPIWFDFESETATSLPWTGALTSLTMTQSGLSVTVTRVGGVAFDIQDNSTNLPKPVSWGDRTLDPFYNWGTGAFVMDFSVPVQGVWIEAGDYGGDADLLQLSAWSGLGGTGTGVASDFDSIPTGPVGPFDYRQLSIWSNTPFQSIVVQGGFPTQNSVYFDNLGVAVPEPSGLALLGLGGLALLRRRRR